MTIATFDIFAKRSSLWHMEAKPRNPLHDTALSAVLARGDDRLLHDAGLDRAALLGPEAAFNDAWRPHRKLWNL